MVRTAVNTSTSATLNSIACAISAPAIHPPLRLPTVPRKRTDVLHLYDKNVSNYLINPASTTTFETGGITSRVFFPQGAFMNVLTRDPVIPGFVTKPVKCLAAGTFQWDWIPIWSDQSVFWDRIPNATLPRSQVMPVCPIGNTTLGPSEVYDTNLADGKLDFLNVRSVGVPTGGNGGETVPGAYYDGRHYAWHYGGRIAVNVFCVTEIGTNKTMTDCVLKCNISCHRFRGDGQPDETNDELWLTVAAGSENGMLTFSAPAGFYTLDISSVSVRNTSANNLNMGPVAWGIQATVCSLWEQPGAGQANLLMPTVLPTYETATFMLERCRVTAASMLISNVTAEIAKSGEVFGIRSVGTEGFFTELNVETITALSGQASTAFTGSLSKGAYTFLEPDQEMLEFNDHATVYLGKVYPFARLAELCFTHVIVGQWSLDNNMGTPSFVTRHDIHLEFISNSQLSKPNLTAAHQLDFENASIALAAGDFFFENPSHLEEIWKWIRRAGTLALKAGASAGARALLEAGMAAMV